MNIWEIIFLFFGFLSLLLSLLFFAKKKGDKVANSILGLYLLLFSCNLCYNVLYWTKQLYSGDFIHLTGVLVLIWISYPPLMYLYIKRIVTKKRFRKVDLIHSLPVLLITLFNSRFFFLNLEKKIKVLVNGSMSDYIFLSNFTHVFVILSLTTYSVLIYKLFKNSHDLNTDKKRWLKWLISAFYSYALAMVIYFTLAYFNIITEGRDYFIMYTIIFCIGLIAYFGFMQPEVFNGLSMDRILPFKKYKNTGLSDNFSLELKDQLLDIIKNEKPYLKSDLKLIDLANYLNISKHHMSQVINEHFDVSFNYFINTYRIKEAIILLENSNDLNISEIIYSSGFNNRVSFYKAFKDQTGITPTEYRLQRI